MRPSRSTNRPVSNLPFCDCSENVPSGDRWLRTRNNCASLLPPRRESLPRCGHSGLPIDWPFLFTFSTRQAPVGVCCASAAPAARARGVANAKIRIDRRVAPYGKPLAAGTISARPRYLAILRIGIPSLSPQRIVARYLNGKRIKTGLPRNEVEQPTNPPHQLQIGNRAKEANMFDCSVKAVDSGKASCPAVRRYGQRSESGILR